MTLKEMRTHIAGEIAYGGGDPDTVDDFEALVRLDEQFRIIELFASLSFDAAILVLKEDALRRAKVQA